MSKLYSDVYCDCFGNIFDCKGECGGTGYLITLCEDTDGDCLGTPYSEQEQCYTPDPPIIENGCELSDNSIYVKQNGEVLYNFSQDIAGFQLVF